MRRVILLTLAAAGCASTPVARTGGARSSTAAEMPSVGARCEGGVCACRALDGSAEKETAPVAAGMKRFELRLNRGMDPTTVSVDGRRALERAPDHPEERCAYVDLAPGQHRVRLEVRAKDAPAGISPSLTVAEYGAVAGRWYQSFDFSCGTSEPCLKDDLANFLDRERAVPRGLHDPCGSTRVESPSWTAEHSPSARLEDLQLELTLKVYAFAPHLPPGSAECHHDKHGE